MYLVDANVLVYAVDREAVHHEAARRWLDEHLGGPPRYVGLPWPSLTAFLRLTTNPRVFERPAPVADAWARVAEWLSRSAAWIPSPGPRHPKVMGELIASATPAANLVPGAHLAALAVEHGLTIASTDPDFARFSQVKWHNPVTGRVH
jgi:hypothetical protein